MAYGPGPWGCKAGDDCGYAHHYSESAKRFRIRPPHPHPHRHVNVAIAIAVALPVSIFVPFDVNVLCFQSINLAASPIRRSAGAPVFKYRRRVALKTTGSVAEVASEFVGLTR